MKKRIFSVLLAVVLFATLVLTIPFSTQAASYRPGTASSSYTTPNVGDIVYLNPKLYTYSSGSNSESLKFSGNYSYNQEKSSSSTEHRTASNKDFRSVAYIYHLSEDVRVPAYSKMTITGYVKSEAKKEGSNNAQNAYAAVVQDWETSGTLGSLYLGQTSNRSYSRSITDKANTTVSKAWTSGSKTIDNSGSGSLLAPDLVLVGWVSGNAKTSSFNANYALYASNNNQAYIKASSITNYIYYNPNGGSGSVATSTKNGNASMTLATADKFSRPGYYISSWNTKADGTGTKYNVGATYSSNSGLYLYAQWTPINYTVTFNANGGSGTMANQVFKWDTAQNLAANTFTYTPKVTFNENGGNTVPDAAVAAAFNGWEDRSSTTYGGTTYLYYQFNAAGYAIRNIDVFQSGYCNNIYNKNGLLDHYVHHGKNEYANGSDSRAPVTGYFYGYPNGAKVSNLTTTSGGTVPLYAKWNYGTTTLPTPTYAGYTFLGWQGDLMDIASFTNGMEINDTSRGTIGNNASYAVTENLIPVVGGTTYTSNYEVCGIYSYDANGNFIRRESSYSTTHTVSANAAFVRIEVNLAKGVSFDQYQSGLTLSYTLPAGTIFPVGGNQTLVAKWDTAKHTVIWKNWDGTVLETDRDLLYGSVPVYNGETPVRAGTEQTEYTFIGWSPAVGAITGDTTYTAVFSDTTRTYDITVDSDESKGVVSVNEKAAVGSEVTVLVTPNNGYTIDSVAIFKTGKPNEMLEFDETTYGFTMPAFHVTVQVTYKQMSAIYSSVYDQVAPTFTVTIPATVELGNEVTVTAENIRVDKGSQVEVGIQSADGTDFTMRNTEGHAFTYRITLNGNSVSDGTKVLVINPDTRKSGSVTLRFEKPTTAIYAGNYTGRVIFTIEVKSSNSN